MAKSTKKAAPAPEPKKETVKAVSKEKVAPKAEAPAVIPATDWVAVPTEAEQKRAEKLKNAEALITYIASCVADGREILINKVTHDIIKLNQK